MILEIKMGTNCEFIAREVIEGGVAPNVATGCAVHGDDNRWHLETGGDVDTFFDLASLTKPLTAVAIARCPGLERTTRLADVLPELADTASAGVTVEQLLSHRAGRVG